MATACEISHWQSASLTESFVQVVGLSSWTLACQPKAKPDVTSCHQPCRTVGSSRLTRMTEFNRDVCALRSAISDTAISKGDFVLNGVFGDLSDDALPFAGTNA